MYTEIARPNRKQQYTSAVVEKVGVIYIIVLFFAISAACLFYERSRYMWQTGHQPVELPILFAVS